MGRQMRLLSRAALLENAGPPPDTISNVTNGDDTGRKRRLQ